MWLGKARERAVQQFVARQNVQHYRNLLETERDPRQRERLEQLLAGALAQLERPGQEKKGRGASIQPRGAPPSAPFWGR